LWDGGTSKKQKWGEKKRAKKADLQTSPGVQGQVPKNEITAGQWTGKKILRKTPDGKRRVKNITKHTKIAQLKRAIAVTKTETGRMTG